MKLFILTMFIPMVTYSETISYNKDIKLILNKHCSQCHSASWPDKNWMDYDTAKKNSQKIKERVFILETMPPGNFTEMTKEERILIKNWVDSGSKQ